MMDILRKNLNILLSFLILILLGGCVTTARKQNTVKIRALERQASSLETQIIRRDSEIRNLINALKKERQEKADLVERLSEQEQVMNNLTQAVEKQKTKIKRKTYYSSVISVQTALRNAGFNLGLIDGKMGRRTRVALIEFQKAHDLPADGRIDKQTWTLLRKYLYLER